MTAIEFNDYEEKDDLKQVREESKDWNPDQWESYLQTLETTEDDDVVYAGELLDEISHESFASLACSHSEKSPVPLTCDFLRAALSKLTTKQRRVIEDIYFNNKLKVTIAKEMGVSKVAVTKIHARALASLKKHFQKIIEEKHKVISLEKKVGG